LDIVHSHKRKSRYDNGGKYTSKELITFFKAVRIRRELNTPYNPQHNGVASLDIVRHQNLTESMSQDKKRLKSTKM
jgi:transposase InsO family protein